MENHHSNDLWNEPDFDTKHQNQKIMKKAIVSRPISPRNWRDKTVYSASKTIPGQSLIPAELLQRHLAGTLPELDLSQRYEYHYDENGEQIGEPLPIEMHELHKLAVAMRKRQFEEATKRKAEQAEKFRDQVIQEYLASQQKTEPKSDSTPVE